MNTRVVKRCRRSSAIHTRVNQCLLATGCLVAVFGCSVSPRTLVRTGSSGVAFGYNWAAMKSGRTSDRASKCYILLHDTSVMMLFLIKYLNQTRISTWPPMCAPRGQGRCSRTVARSQVPEDYTKSPRRRARSKIVLARRGRLVSRSGENKGNSAMCEPSTLYRAVGSRPTHRQRSARTSSPRRDRTARASEGM